MSVDPGHVQRGVGGEADDPADLRGAGPGLGRGERDGDVEVLAVDGVIHRGADVVGVGGVTLGPLHLAGTREFDGAALRVLRVPRGVPITQPGGLVVVSEAFLAVLADRLEESIAGLGSVTLGDHE